MLNLHVYFSFFRSSLETSETEIRTSKSSSQDESSKKILTRGDSIKALQHKYQQATGMFPYTL